MESMTQELRDTISEALYKESIAFEVEEENGCLIVTTDAGRVAFIRSPKQNAVLNIGLVRWAEKEGFSEEQANDLRVWISLDNLTETIHYLCGKHFNLKGTKKHVK